MTTKVSDEPCKKCGEDTVLIFSQPPYGYRCESCGAEDEKAQRLVRV